MVGSLPELWPTSPSLSKVRAGSPGEATACGPGPVPLPIPVGANFRAVLTAASAQPESVPAQHWGQVGSVGEWARPAPALTTTDKIRLLTPWPLAPWPGEPALRTDQQDGTGTGPTLSLTTLSRETNQVLWKPEATEIREFRA